jgi:antitoxin YefM
MQVVSFTELRKNMKTIMDQCCDNHDLTVITRQKEPPMIMMSLDEYNSWQETYYLMKSHKNHSRLMESIENVKKGNVQKRELLEVE